MMGIMLIWGKKSKSRVVRHSRCMDEFLRLCFFLIPCFLDVPNGIFVHLFFAKLFCLDLRFLPVYIVGV
jgi:hypothetical protein